MSETARDTTTALDAILIGNYASFSGGVTAAGDPRPAVRWNRLLDAEMQAEIDKRFLTRFGCFEPRAVRSIWIKWYLNIFLPPLLVADVFLMQTLAVELDNVRFIMANDMRIAAVRLDQPSRDTRDADPFVRFDTLVFHHLSPLVAMWSERTGLTSRVLWSNVGNTFEAMLRRIERVSGSSQRFDEVQRLLDVPRWPDGRANPLYAAVHYIGAHDTKTRRRRVCCLQYLLPDRRFCSACPIEEAHVERTEQ